MKTLLILCSLWISLQTVSAQSVQDSVKVKHAKQDSSANKHAKKAHPAAKVQKQDSTASNWRIQGSNSISGNQSSFSNWQQGGTNNLTVDARFNYDFNYEKGIWSWDNKVLLSYGFNKQKANSLKKTDDRVELTSILARKIDPVWNYSLFGNFKTQLDKGLDPKDPKNSISHFMSPLFIHAGPGIFWKKNDDFKINFSPATARFIFVHSHFTKMGKSFGVDRDEVKRFEFGASVYGYYKFQIMKNVTLENIIALYGDYLYKVQNVDFDYQGSLYLKVNKFISANVYYEALYDNDTVEKLQQKQSVGVGFKYSFHK